MSADESVEHSVVISQGDPLIKPSAESLAYFSLMGWPQLWEKGLFMQSQDSLDQFLALAESSLDRSAKLDIRRPLDAAFLRYLSRRAERNRSISSALQYSQLALKADPALPGLITGHFRLDLACYGLSSSLNTLWKNHRTASEDFWYQLGATAGMVLFISLFLLGSSLIFLFWLAVKGLPYQVHFLSDLWPFAIPAYSRMAISSFLMLAVLLVLGAVSLVLPVALLAITGSFYFGKKEKVLLVLSLLMLAASGFGLTACRHLYARLDDADLEAVSRAMHSPWDPALVGKLTAMQETDPANLTPSFCLGLLEKRRGNFDEADRYLRHVLENSNNNARALNNLGNIHYYLGRIDSAEHYYQASAQSGSHSGIPHYNLAQVFFKQVDFKSADQERAYGMALSGDAIKLRSAATKPELVLDELVPADYLWGKVWKDFNPFRSFNLSEAASLAVPGFWLPGWMGLALLVFSLMMVTIFFPTTKASHCRICGRVICPNCQVTTPEQEHICPDCHKLASAASSPELREKIVANLAAGKHKRKIWLGAISNLVAPGVAVALDGMPAWSFFIALSWGLIFAGFRWLKLSLYPYDFWQFLIWTWTGRIALAWLILSWLFGWVAFLKYINLITPAREKSEVKINGR